MANAEIIAMTRQLASENALDVRVNAVAAGAAADEAPVLLQRPGDAADFAGPVMFLLGGDSREMTGQVLWVSGGRSMP